MANLYISNIPYGWVDFNEAMRDGITECGDDKPLGGVVVASDYTVHVSCNPVARTGAALGVEE